MQIELFHVRMTYGRGIQQLYQLDPDISEMLLLDRSRFSQIATYHLRLRHAFCESLRRMGRSTGS